MKKVLIYLQSLLLTTTPFLSTISCNKTLGKSTKNKLNPPGVISEQEKEIIKNTSLFTKLLLLSRHENLNFNSTDVLNSVFAPKTTWNAFPRVYTVNGKNYNLTDYTDKLTTEYSNLGKLNSTDFDPFFASTLTGMYDNKLYQNFINQSTIKKHNIFNYLDINNAQISNDFNRQQLAWANFTGPLSKYIADKKVFNYHTDHNDESDAKYYGRFLNRIKTEKRDAQSLLTDKIVKTNNEIKLINATDKEMNQEFGKYQIKIFNTQISANFAAKILDFMPFIQNFNKTATGSIYGLRLLNNLSPFTDTKTNMDATYVLFYLLQNSIEWMKSFSKKYINTSSKNATKPDEKAKEVYEKANELTNPTRKTPGLFKKIGIDFLSQANKSTIDGFKIQMLMNKKDEKGNQIELFKTIKEFKKLTSEWIKDWNKNMKIEFFEFFKKQIQSLQKLVSTIDENISNFIQEGVNAFTSEDDVINLFTILGDMMAVIADHQDKFLEIDGNLNYKNKDFDSLTKAQQQEIANLFGFKENNFEEGSVLNELHKVLNDKTFNKLILNHDGPLYKFNSKNAKAIHEQLIQYALDDKYWTIDKKSFKLIGAISGDKSLKSKFSYSLEYKGKGDKTVTKFLDQPVNLPNNFNPIEPWLTPTDVSKSWTNQDYIDYTGLGNNEFKDVNFKYNVEWSNVSGEPEFPYWVITKIDCFRNENGTWKQFYPVI